MKKKPKPIRRKMPTIKSVKFSKSLTGRTVEASSDVRPGESPTDVLIMLGQWVAAQLTGESLLGISELKRTLSELNEKHRELDRAIQMGKLELMKVTGEVSYLEEVKRKLEFEIPREVRR